MLLAEDEATDKTLIPAAVSDAVSTQFTKFRRRFQLAGGRLGSTRESPPGSTRRLVVASSDAVTSLPVAAPSHHQDHDVLHSRRRGIRTLLAACIATMPRSFP